MVIEHRSLQTAGFRQLCRGRQGSGAERCQTHSYSMDEGDALRSKSQRGKMKSRQSSGSGRSLPRQSSRHGEMPRQGCEPPGRPGREQLCSGADPFSASPHGIMPPRALISAITNCLEAKPDRPQGRTVEQKQQFAPVNSCELAPESCELHTGIPEVPGKPGEPKHVAKHRASSKEAGSLQESPCWSCCKAPVPPTAPSGGSAGVHGAACCRAPRSARSTCPPSQRGERLSALAALLICNGFKSPLR